MLKGYSIPISIHKYPNINTKKISDTLIRYLETNRCCVNYPNCTHPKYQSDPKLFDLNNVDVKKLKKYYFNSLRKLFKSYKIIENKSWVFFTKSNTETSSAWHTHENKLYKDKNIKQVSGICYITKTNLGTLFENEYFLFSIKPCVHHWYIFDSALRHKPLQDFVNEKRIVVATSTIMKVNPKID